ncbi:MAG: hypothetical protein IJW22_09595, partial [Clostridia bacterium]|nr:hypothetical protein [Clostridia bacterium]
DEPLGYQYGYFDYQHNSQSTGMDITLTAYKDDGEEEREENNDNEILLEHWRQYTQSGEVVAFEPHYSTFSQTYVLHHTLDAEPGASGGPIYYYHAQSGKFRVLAVHNVEYKNSAGGGILNQGCRITSQLFSFIYYYTAFVYRAEE